jgi:Flp pilus assembly pilin Flp
MIRTCRGERGNALVEYIILLAAIAAVLVGIVVQYGHDLDAEWRNTDDSTGPIDEVASSLGDDGTGESDGCPYYYNSSTGRWHDPDTNLFVSFDDASAGGCS